ncbi:PAS domain-containing protein [Robertkochia flava]|uniref:PAS domain-containing protein n=1 Tax=Robertkochia flava TaxID=3447986 RepID=UPI001CCA9759|nr:PAS domain-containing protein [Robertkochia marina]
MDSLFNNTWIVNILSGLLTSVILFAGGFFLGKQRERKKSKGRSLEEYEFYPFIVDEHGFPNFDLPRFNEGVRYLLKSYDFSAARQLLFIGEQNNVRFFLTGDELRNYKKFFKKYNGNEVIDDNLAHLENYKTLVKLIGKTFRHSGIEILLHNLMNPSKSIIALENPVTGRQIGDGTTMLVLDLKKRNALKQDKLNYELNIGSRTFKCTTIPIYRKDFGLIGAVCINIDVNYINDHVMETMENVRDFFRDFCETEMVLEENILSKYEYKLASAGKRHFKDRAGAH